MRQDRLTTQFHEALSAELQSYFRPGLPNRGTGTVARSQDQLSGEQMQQMELDLQVSDAAITQRFKAGFRLA